jgi:hypothetical protein
MSDNDEDVVIFKGMLCFIRHSMMEFFLTEPVVLLGDSSVGKSNLLKRFTTGEFSEVCS